MSWKFEQNISFVKGIADSLAKTIGTVYYKRPANYYLATSAIYNILKSLRNSGNHNRNHHYKNSQ